MSNEPGGPAPLPDPYSVPSSPYGTPRAAEPYGTPPTDSSYGPPPTGSPYGQAPAFGEAPSYGQAPAYGQVYDQPPYGSPYGPPAYGQSYYPGPTQPVGTEPLAIASLVTSLVGILLPICTPVGLGLGIAALRRIRRNGHQGRGMAIAGIVVGALGTAYLIVLTLIVVALVAGTMNADSSDGTYSYGTDEPGPGDELTDDTALPDYTLRTDLLLGDCLDYASYEPDMSDTEAIDCSVEHEGEVVAISYLSEPTNPDLSVDDPVWNAAWDRCVSEAELVLPEDYETYGELVLYTPHPDDFDALGAHTGYCVFSTVSELLTGSAVAHTLTFGTGSAT